MDQFIPLKENDPTKIYTILQKISSGNNKNDLYKIKHKKTGEIFVAKIFKNNLNVYHNQIKNLIKFENPYLVQYYSKYIQKEKIWIITEYCDCGNVQDIMRITNKSYKEIEIASIISMVLKGLQYLHLQKKYHGGIKLSNILINNEGVIKLSDYNLSEQLLFNSDENIKNTPPELLGKNKLENFSVKSDIWYIGLACIELAEGTSEIKNGKLIQEKKSQNGMKNSNLWSLEFIDFIQKCLNENPLNRPSAANLLNHPFIINNNKGKIIIKKKINSIKSLIDIYREKIDEQEEKNNINDLGKDNIEVTSFNDNLNKDDLIDEIEYKKNSASLNVNKSKYKHKSLLINREYRMNQYKKIKKFKLGSKSIQIQNSTRKKISTFTLNNKDSSNKKSTKTTIKKAINSNEIFAINEDLLRKKRHSLVNKYLKNSLKLQKQNNNNNEIQNITKLNNTLDNIRQRNNLMTLLNTFERDKKSKNKSLNKSLRVKNIENIFNIFNNKVNITNSIKLTNISKNTISNNKINDKSISSIESLRFSNADKKVKNFNSIDNNNIRLKTRNKKSNGGNPSLSDLNDNNKNLRKSNKKKNKILRNLLLKEKQNETGYEKNIINLENNNGYKIINTNSNDIKVYNNEYIFKLNNSANIGNKYTKKREKHEFKFQNESIKSNKLNKTSKAPIVYYINQNEIKKIQKIPMSSNNKKNLIKKKKLKLINNPKIMTNNLYENSNIYNDSIQEMEKSGNIYNINNTDININLNNINNSNYYINPNTSKYYINNTFSYNNNNMNNNILLSEDELKHLCLNNKINESELPQLITELAGLENKMNQEIQKIKELYEPIIIQHKDGIKFLKQNPFLKNIKEFKNYEMFKNKMKYNTNDDFENRNVSSSVHNLNKIKISFYRANDIEELNISANKYLFDKTGHYNNNMEI